MLLPEPEPIIRCVCHPPVGVTAPIAAAGRIRFAVDSSNICFRWDLVGCIHSTTGYGIGSRVARTVGIAHRNIFSSAPVAMSDGAIDGRHSWRRGGRRCFSFASAIACEGPTKLFLPVFLLAPFWTRYWAAGGLPTRFDWPIGMAN